MRTGRPKNPGSGLKLRRLVGMAALSLSWLVAAGTPAQEPGVERSPKAAAPTADPADAAIKSNLRDAASKPLPGEVGPPTFLLEDRDHKLQPVLGFKFEDFINLFRQQQLNQQEQRPSYVIQQMSISGAAIGQRADLTIEFTLAIQDSGWVRVPLRLTKAVLKDATYDGPGEQQLHVEETINGQVSYVSWIRAASDKKESQKEHRLKLSAQVALAGIGSESQLKLQLPRATKSELKLTVPAEHAVARVSDSCELDQTKELAGGKTQFTVLGAGGEFELAWRQAESRAVESPTVLEASGAQVARIDGRSVNTEARLTVRSFGGQFDHFQVRLPVGAELVGANQPGIQLALVTEENPPEGTDAQGRLVDVKLERKTAGPVEVKLVTERPHNLGQADASIQLAGFEVQGAVRQYGNIAVEVIGNWQVMWGETRNVRQVDELPAALRREEVVAGFEYFVQPYSLTARVVPQKVRLRVQPEYLFLVGPDKVELEARFKYTVRGAKIRTVDLQMPGWEVDSIEPGNLVAIDGAATLQESAVAIPLAQPMAGDFELKVLAHRSIPAAAEMLSFDLPQPVAAASPVAAIVVLPTDVAVVAADNVELRPQSDALVNLSPQPLKLQWKLPERQQDPLLFRSEANPARFVGGFQIHPQSISSEVVSHVDLDEQDIRVEQRISYLVAYEPVDKLSIEVPSVLAADKLRVSLDGQKLSLNPVREQLDAETQGVVTMRVALPKPRIGRCELQINYLWPQEKLLPATSVPVAVPLVMPSGGKLAHNEVFVSGKAGMTLSARKGPWTTDEKSRRPALRPGSLALVGTEPAGEIALAVTVRDRPTDGLTVVERGWIQTQLTDADRQERAVFRFTSSESQIRLTLPAGIVESALQVTLDGARAAATKDSAGDITLALPAAAAQHEHVLELRYYYRERPRSGQLELAAPQFKPAAWARQLYWQVVLPNNEHLLTSSPRFAGESAWTWKGLLWQRQAALEQPELERLLGVTAATALPEASNRYLFSAVGSPESLELWTARRSSLVFTASLAVLLCGLALVYIPALRHPGLLFVVAVLLVAASLIQPETAVLLAQSAALGLVLSLVGWWLARTGARRPPMTAPIRGSSRAVAIDRSATEMYHRAAKGSSHASTATAPMPVPSSSPEDKP